MHFRRYRHGPGIVEKGILDKLNATKEGERKAAAALRSRREFLSAKGNGLSAVHAKRMAPRTRETWRQQYCIRAHGEERITCMTFIGQGMVVPTNVLPQMQGVHSHVSIYQQQSNSAHRHVAKRPPSSEYLHASEEVYLGPPNLIPRMMSVRHEHQHIHDITHNIMPSILRTCSLRMSTTPCSCAYSRNETDGNYCKLTNFDNDANLCAGCGNTCAE